MVRDYYLKFYQLAAPFCLIAIFPIKIYAQAITSDQSADDANNQLNKKIYVQVKETKLRAAPKQWAAGVSNLEYGTALDIQEEDQGWFKAALSNGKSGYVHSSAVTNRRIVLKGEQRELSDLAVDENTVSLAGKGFGVNVEEAYKSRIRQDSTEKSPDKNIDLHYSEAEQILTQPRGSEAQLELFVKQGMLNG